MNSLRGQDWAVVCMKKIGVLPVSNGITDLCEISDLLFFVSYFASQSKGMKFGDYFFDVCCVN